MTAGLARELVTCLEQAPESDGTRALRARLLSPTGLNAALRSEPFDAEAARRLLAATSSVLGPALLDALEAVTLRKARRLIYDRLRSEGAALLPIVYRRLGGTPPWYFARNLLALRRDIGDQADGAPTGLDQEATLQLITADPSHAREQVRLEALRVLVQMPGCRALRDDSLRVVSPAIDTLLAEVSGEPHGRTPHGPPARETHARERAGACRRVDGAGDCPPLRRGHARARHPGTGRHAGAGGAHLVAAARVAPLAPAPPRQDRGVPAGRRCGARPAGRTRRRRARRAAGTHARQPAGVASHALVGQQRPLAGGVR
jgi:hypothetical protein